MLTHKHYIEKSSILHNTPHPSFQPPGWQVCAFDLKYLEKSGAALDGSSPISQQVFIEHIMCTLQHVEGHFRICPASYCSFR